MLVYLAGVEGGDPQRVREHIEYAFYSYYYLRKKDTQLEGAKECHKVLFIDSGAHSFFSEMADEGIESASVHKKKSKTKETPQEYFDKYLEWLIKNYHRIDYYAELDIGEIVGQETVLEWRKRLKEHNIYDKCVTVYHPKVMTWEDYIDMLEDSQSGYVALEGDRSGRKRLNYNKLIKPAYERGIKVHGFAMTKTEVLKNYPFYSVDSTSWLQSEMYGTIPFHNDGRIQGCRYKDKDKLIQKLGDLDVNILFGEDKALRRLYTMKIGIKAYKEYEQFYTELWQKRNINWDI